jgi:mono/diheme cytochrome c family protein
MRVPATALLTAAYCFAQTPPASSPEGIAYFEKNIRPLLAANCYGCHSSKLASPMSGLTLDTKAGMLRGGKTGVPAIVPGKPEDSLIVAAVKHAANGLSMPPGKTLDPAEIDALVQWIKMGAPDPRTEAASAPASSYDWDKARKHWSFQPVQSAAVWDR